MHSKDSSPTPGHFITLEGIDGAGKSTHARFIADYLHSKGLSVVSTREPGGAPLGEALRTLVLHHPMHLETEALLMFAARREHLAQVIEPALARGEWVVSDRFTDSTFAYQGGGHHLSCEKLSLLEDWVHPHRQPDMTLLFDLPPEIARARATKRGDTDQFEQKTTAFFANVRAEYLRRAKQYPQRFHLIDATQSIVAIQASLVQVIDNCLHRFVQSKQATS